MPKKQEKIQRFLLTNCDSSDIITKLNFSGAKYGGVTQLVEYPVHTRSVTCSSQVAATRPVGQAVKTPPFHGGNMGSIPVRVTKKRGHPFGCPLFLLTRGNRLRYGKRYWGNGSFDSLRSLRTTDKWGKPSGFSVILSKPKARRRIRNPFGESGGRLKSRPYKGAQ